MSPAGMLAGCAAHWERPSHSIGRPVCALGLALPLRDIRKELERERTGKKISTSVEIPFSAETKRVLEYASEEADGLEHRHIGPEHLLLGLMREASSRAAIALARHGMELEGVRQQIRDLAAGAAKRVPYSAVQAQLELIIESADQLSRSLSADPDAALQAHLLLLELQTLKSLLDEQQ